MSFLQLIIVAVAVAASALPSDAGSSPVKFACRLGEDSGVQICKYDALKLSVHTTHKLPIDVEIEKDELAALIKSWSPVDIKAERPTRQIGYGAGVAGSSAQASSGSYGAGVGGGYPAVVGGYPAGVGAGFGASNSFAIGSSFGGGYGR